MPFSKNTSQGKIVFWTNLPCLRRWDFERCFSISCIWRCCCFSCPSANFTTIESVGMIDSDPGANKTCLHSRTFTQVSNVQVDFLYLKEKYISLFSSNKSNVEIKYFLTFTFLCKNQIVGRNLRIVAQ